MPLMHKKSKKAFEHNIKAEMHAGKPQDQSLAIAYSVKRKAKKKMAEGGMAKRERPSTSKGQKGWTHEKDYTSGVHREQGGGESRAGEALRSPNYGSMQKHEGNVEAAKRAHKSVIEQSRSMPKPKLQGLAEGGNVSAKTEARPMPDQTTNSSAMKSRNAGNKPASHDSWTDNSTVTQAQSNNGRKVRPIARPRMVPSDAFSTRLYDMEGNLQESASPGLYGEQPATWHDEDEAKKQGLSPDMADEHSTHRKPYAKGGEVESQDYDHKAKNQYEDDLTDLPPSEDEGDAMAMSHNEIDADMEGSSPDMEPEHNNGRMPYADGGEIEEDHHDSITAAIMARRDRLHAEIDSGAHDMDTAVRMAEGGRLGDEILSHNSIYSDDSDQADLSRNHDEDANEEDQLSFNALRRENYNSSNLDIENPSDSGQIGDSEEEDSENKHDMIGSIRSKMKARKQFRG